MKTTAATRWIRLRMECVPSISSSGRAHHWSGYFSAKPVQTRVMKRCRQHGVLHALEGQHAQTGVSGGPGSRGSSPEAQADQLADPVAALVQQHQADGDRNHQQVEFAHPAQHGRLGLPLGNVYLADGESRARTGMALAAGLRQVLRIDGGFRVGRGQDVVHAVATGAVGHGLRAGLGGQPVEGGIEAHQPVGRQAELARQPDVCRGNFRRCRGCAPRSPGRLRWCV